MMIRERVQETSVVAGGLRMHTLLRGSRERPVVTFVHGLAASLSVWSDQAERLAPDYRTLQYDLRSHGATEARDEPCSRADLANDLIALLDGLDIRSTFIVGHSAGGVVAMQVAVDHPTRVAGLVLVGTASECNDKTAAWYEKTAADARAGGGREALRALGMRDDDPAPDGPGFARLAMAMRSLNGDPLTDRLAGLSIPTLIIVGENDFLGVGGSVILSRTIVGSQLEIVPGRGHGIYLEDPAWFASRLRAFLDHHS